MKYKILFVLTVIIVMLTGCAPKPLDKVELNELVKDTKIYNKYNEYHFLSNGRFINITPKEKSVGRWFIGTGWVGYKGRYDDMLCVVYEASVNLGDNYKIGDPVLCNRVFNGTDDTYDFLATHSTCVTKNKEDIECDWNKRYEYNGFKVEKEIR